MGASGPPDGKLALQGFCAAIQIAMGDPELCAAAVDADSLTCTLNEDDSITVSAGDVETPVSADLLAEQLGAYDDGLDAASGPPSAGGSL
jgi:hypothetical protein